MAIGQQLQRQERDLACKRVWHLVVGRRRSRSRRFGDKKRGNSDSAALVLTMLSTFLKTTIVYSMPMDSNWVQYPLPGHHIKASCWTPFSLRFWISQSNKTNLLLLSNLFWVTLRKKHFKLQTYGLNSCFHLIKASWTSFSLRFWISQQ